jgi:predicted amidohydrolase
MRVGFYQFSPVFGDVSANLKKVSAALSGMEADLIVLPELFNTGYQFVSEGEARELAEPIPGGETCATLMDLAHERRTYIVAGLAECDKDDVYNSSLLVGPEGYIGKYRKLHLFYEEKRWFRPGQEPPPVFDVGGVRLGLMICFDWIFPETARMLSLQGADVLCHPANLVFTLCHQAMLIRCIENRVYAITCNRTGQDARKPDETLTYTGGSQIVDPRGKLLVRASAESDESQVVEIHPERSRNKDFNEYNNIVRDRRVDIYEMLSRPVVS